NIIDAYYIRKEGFAVYSVNNYLHTFMFIAFIGDVSTIQPLINYYYVSKQEVSIKKTIKLAERTVRVVVINYIAIGYFGADYLVSIFSVESSAIAELASTGLKLFFIGYLFMGINFVYMTYYQSIGNVKPSIMITVFRGFILLALMLFILPKILGN